ncbi:COX15/CtaA family protein [Litchfieldia salsa]|uniref:Heme A synthase n=1 Tax=Litchfieldia salsa TaxID=930152 RepID=A0A1H0RJA4_9BACI|nr:heme A synthase [Litchfieldia salsa]SDP28968.1 cytochrome c oxidase assembly protein subunit 15 [Litchfieldia salsa]
MQRFLKWFAVLTTIGMLFVLLGGALVTKTESGAGCGDSWPLCHGQLVPSNITPELIIELSHRVVSGAVGIMVLTLSVWAYRAIGHIREVKFLSILSFTFLLLQGLIGAAAVVWGQSDAILALHFGISLISFASVFLLTLLIFEVDRKFSVDSVQLNKVMYFHIYGITIYSYLVVYTGALVRHKSASLACPDWPVCNFDNPGLPTTTYEWIQMGHRLAAGIIFIWIIIAVIHAVRHYKGQPVIFWSWVICGTLVTLQVISGATIVYTNLNLFVSLAHALFISCLFGVLSYLILIASRCRSKKINSASDINKQDNDPSITS